MKTVKFDQTIQYFYRELAWLWRDDGADRVKEVRGTRSSNLTLNKNVGIFSENYDLVIIANGIWEISGPQQCLRNAPPNSTVISRLELALDRIHRNTPKNLQVIFRTNGFDVRNPEKNDEILDSIEFTKQYFYDNNKQNEASVSTNHDGAASSSTFNIGLVDWGGVMKHRSFGKDRIKGDHPAHYGLEGRTLYIQQLMHELVKADLMKSSGNEKVDLSEWHKSVSS
jgi:hypothetical protein